MSNRNKYIPDTAYAVMAHAATQKKAVMMVVA